MRDYSELSSKELIKELKKAEDSRDGEAYVEIIEAGGFEIQYSDLYEQGIASRIEKEKKLEGLLDFPKERNSLEGLAIAIRERLQKGGKIVGKVSCKFEEKDKRGNGAVRVTRIYDFRKCLNSYVTVDAGHDTQTEADEEEKIDSHLRDLNFYLKSEEHGLKINHDGVKEVTISSGEKSDKIRQEPKREEVEKQDADGFFELLIQSGFRPEDYPEAIREFLKRRGRREIFVGRASTLVSRAKKGQLISYAQKVLIKYGHPVRPEI